MSSSKHWAHNEILGPLYEPEPYQLFQMRAPSQSNTSNTAPKQSSRQSSFPRSSATLTQQPSHTSPTSTVVRDSVESTTEHVETAPSSQTVQRRRTLSLEGVKTSIHSAWSKTQKRIAKMTERPLEAIKRATKAADRAPHLRKTNITRADPIDVLDDTGIGGVYHHDGPYDATLASRNRDKRYAPVEAVKETNTEALKATPRENVIDSLQKHVPLQGTATIPPGRQDMNGRVMRYEEGADLMREPDAPGGAYGRWDNVKYHPEDLQGQGEPSYTFEKRQQDKEHLSQRPSDTNNAYEMQPTSRTTGTYKNDAVVRERSGSLDSAGPSNSKGKRLSDGIKRRIGSIRRKHDDV